MRRSFVSIVPGAALAVGLAVGASAGAQEQSLERINGHPNLNGVWQTLNTAHWNLEAHAAEPLKEFWRLGALGAIPAGDTVVVEGTIPYKPEALKQRDVNRAGWPATDPVAKCYLPGIPRSTYEPFPWEIIQGDGDILFAYSFASANRVVNMSAANQLTAEQVPNNQWMGWSNGRWEGDTLIVETVANDDRTWLDRAGNYHSSDMTVTERFIPISPNHLRYEATITDPRVFTRPWTISMPLYRRMEQHVEPLEYKCVEFAEPLLYGEFLKVPPK